MPPRETPLWFHGLVHVGLLTAAVPPVVALWLAIRWRQWDEEWRLRVGFACLLLAIGGLLYVGRALADALWTGWPARVVLAVLGIAFGIVTVTAVPARTTPAPAKRVAVVGAGTSGMHAAWMLDRMGVDVTVYEAAPQVGGHALT